jgi:D-lyxose ketol-isomerase
MKYTRKIYATSAKIRFGSEKFNAHSLFFYAQRNLVAARIGDCYIENISHRKRKSKVKKVIPMGM